MRSLGKPSKNEEEVFHVGMELALSVCGISDLRLPEVITKARVVAPADSSSAEENSSSVSDIRRKRKKARQARWVLPFANHSAVSNHPSQEYYVKVCES
jgi:hypothetical protein